MERVALLRRLQDIIRAACVDDASSLIGELGKAIMMELHEGMEVYLADGRRLGPPRPEPRYTDCEREHGIHRDEACPRPCQVEDCGQCHCEAEGLQ